MLQSPSNPTNSDQKFCLQLQISERNQNNAEMKTTNLPNLQTPCNLALIPNDAGHGSRFNYVSQIYPGSHSIGGNNR